MEKFFKGFEWIINTVLFFLLLAIIALTTIQVVLRYLFNSSIPWSLEFVVYAFVWLICLGMGMAFGNRTHIYIDFFVHQLKKSKAVVFMFIEILNLGFMGFLVCIGYIATAKMVETGALSPVMGIPTSYIYAAIPVGALISCIFCIRNIIKYFPGRGVNMEG